MNALRHVAVSTFQTRTFHKRPQKYDVVTAKLNETSGVDWVQNLASLADIDAISQDAPTLLLVKVNYDALVSRHAFHSSVYDCQKLFKTFHIDMYGLGMVANDMTGFHFLDEIKSDNCNSYYLQCMAYKILWSYDRHKRCSRAVVFVVSSKRGLPSFNDLIATMRVNVDLLSHPLLLPLSAGIQTLAFFDSELRFSYDTCCIIETSTGYRNGSGPMVDDDALLGHKDLSRKMSVLVRKAEKFVRQIKQWKLAIAALESNLLGTIKPAENPNELVHQSPERVSAATAIHLIQRKLDAMEIDFAYVRARASNQAVAVCHCPLMGVPCLDMLTTGKITQMIAQKDTLTSIKLAMTATRDSSSMKVVAIMTMAFLPGTFFAAVYAIPSLEWDTENVIRSNFWVYIAFTLPSTLLVFIFWASLTQRHELLALYRKVLAGPCPAKP
jgi:hypothetical protein